MNKIEQPVVTGEEKKTTSQMVVSRIERQPASNTHTCRLVWWENCVQI